MCCLPTEIKATPAAATQDKSFGVSVSLQCSAASHTIGPDQLKSTLKPLHPLLISLQKNCIDFQAGIDHITSVRHYSLTYKLTNRWDSWFSIWWQVIWSGWFMSTLLQVLRSFRKWLIFSTSASDTIGLAQIVPSPLRLWSPCMQFTSGKRTCGIGS